MNAKEKSIEEVLKLTTPKAQLSEQERKLVDNIAINYERCYLVPFCELQWMEEETFVLLKNRIINVAAQGEHSLVEALQNISSGSKWLESDYYNLIHANADEERAIVEACQAGVDNIFTYMFLLMGHKVTSFVYNIKFVGYRYIEQADLYNELIIELFRICSTYPLDKYTYGGLNYPYVYNSLMHFLYDEVLGKNAIISCPAATKKRMERIKKTLEANCDMDGKTTLTTEEIRQISSARKSELDVFYMLSNSVSFDSNEGFINKTLEDETANIFVEQFCPEEENVCQHIAKNLRFTEEEINELIKALIKHVDECHTTATGKIRKISRRSLRTFCQKQGKTINTREVKQILEEYAYAKTGRKIFFA